MKRLAEIIVSATIQPADSIVDSVAGGQNQHWSLVSFPECFQNLPTGELRHQQVQHDRVILPTRRLEKSFLTVRSFIDSITIFAQYLSNCAEQIGFIFDD